MSEQLTNMTVKVDHLTICCDLKFYTIVLTFTQICAHQQIFNAFASYIARAGFRTAHTQLH